MGFVCAAGIRKVRQRGIAAQLLQAGVMSECGMCCVCAAGSRTVRQRGIAAGRPVRGAAGNGLEWDHSDHLALSGVDGLGPGPKPTAAQ